MKVTSLFLKKLFSSQYSLIFYSSIWMIAAYNWTFYGHLTAAFPFQQGFSLFFVAVVSVLFLLQNILLSLFASKYLTKPLIIISFMIAASSAYFMETYGVVIDSDMLRNTIQSDIAEISGLMNLEYLGSLIILGVLPSIIVIKSKINYHSLITETGFKFLTVIVYLIVAITLIWSFSGNFTSFFREYKSIRYHVNPLYPLYSSVKLTIESAESVHINQPIISVSEDAKIIEPHDDEDLGTPHRELIIMVVGEAVRSDHFQLNGYPRETNPALSKIENIVSFNNVSSCGTSTAVSVPCLFSPMTRGQYKNNSIDTHENVLDILQREGVNILWRDNNSSSKGVANRVEYQDFRDPKLNPICDSECRDIGMLAGLDKYIAEHPTGDILIILHQMGNHGPEYYKRYPKEFEYFTPNCKNNRLGECSNVEITNSYDNSVRYTDFFLSHVIAFIKSVETDFEAGMFYISDHGESLGENGLYLHGLPYTLAPKSQKHVPAVIWGSKHFDFSFKELNINKGKQLSHDAVYCTLLTMFEIDTLDCKEKQTLFIKK